MKIGIAIAGFSAAVSYISNPVHLGAQEAWLAPKGEGSVSVTYSNLAFGGHFGVHGEQHPSPNGLSRAQTATLGFEYSLTNRLALEVSLPYVAARYRGKDPSPSQIRPLFEQVQQLTNYHHQFLDDGFYHGTIQDFQFKARYNLLSAPVVFTPFISTGIPSHDYAYLGEAAPGLKLRTLSLGTNVGRRLNPVLPNAYVHGQFSYSFVEKHLGISLRHADWGAEFGYFVKPSLSLRVFNLWEHTFGGVETLPFCAISFQLPCAADPVISLNHYRILHSAYWQLGGGASYSVRRSVDLFAGIYSSVAGRATHYGTGIVVGTSWSFQTPGIQRQERLPVPVPTINQSGSFNATITAARVP